MRLGKQLARLPREARRPLSAELFRNGSDTTPGPTCLPQTEEPLRRSAGSRQGAREARSQPPNGRRQVPTCGGLLGSAVRPQPPTAFCLLLKEFLFCSCLSVFVFFFNVVETRGGLTAGLSVQPVSGRYLKGGAVARFV